MEETVASRRIVLLPHAATVTAYGALEGAALYEALAAGANAMQKCRRNYGDGAQTYYATQIDDRSLRSTWAGRWLTLRRCEQPFAGGATGDCGLTRLENYLATAAAHTLEANKLNPEQRTEAMLVLCSTKGNIHLLGDQPEDARLLLADLGRRVAHVCGIRREPITISNACISGLAGLVAAARILASRRASHVLVVAADQMSDFITSGFLGFRSVSPTPCRPFDAAHNGLSLGEAAAAMLLTSVEAAELDNNPDAPLCLLGGAFTNDANHISGPSRDGRPLAAAINNALRQAGLAHDHSDVAFVCPHGTGTVYNDMMEAQALSHTHFVGQRGKPVTSLKPYFGHTLAASGLLETIVCCEALRRGQVLPVPGFEACARPGPQLLVPRQLTAAPGRAFVKTASGFGGCNAALVIGRPTSATPPFAFAKPSTELTRTVRIANGRVTINGRLQCELHNSPLDDLLAAAYGQLKPYDKWHKMDRLSRLAHVGFELLFAGCDHPERSAVLVCGRNASLDSDERHQDALRQAAVKPATFVYTLPNIAIGEVCIRHHIQGETLYTARYRNDPESQLFLATHVLDLTQARQLAVAWLDVRGEHYEGELRLYRIRNTRD